ncbi:MAG TPA: hypothetical protein VKV95_09550 [Terriglobia bacterium]|nr:hypothetical protein [Terriglobia bacterium]
MEDLESSRRVILDDQQLNKFHCGINVRGSLASQNATNPFGLENFSRKLCIDTSLSASEPPGHNQIQVILVFIVRTILWQRRRS